MKKKLKDFVEITQGINSSRIRNENRGNLYDQRDFEKDLLRTPLPNNILGREQKGDFTLRAGDVIINNMKQQATIVSPESVGKILTMNFLRVEFLNDKLDKRFFIYLFNENRQMKYQKERATQGVSSFVQKIPINNLKQLTIPEVSIEKQQKIGQAYAELLAVRKKYLDLIKYNDQMTLEILEQATKEE